MLLFFVVLVPGGAVLLWFCMRLLAGRRHTTSSTETLANVLIVRRALSPAHYFFLSTFAKSNGLQVMVDRRTRDRRREQRRLATDRRHSGDRRKAEPSTWRDGDFVVPGGLHRRSRSAVPPVRVGSRAV